MLQPADEKGLSIESVGKTFESFSVLTDVNLDVREGELVTLLGPSGSGKTTLLNIIAGFQYADSGTVRLAGRDITAVPPPQNETLAWSFRTMRCFRT
ncbi:ATP-binding cassette domain-containing protein [Bradyrhizobium sp. DASA03007]|uniref:ATP-binding cassette domain-containing protein n=1 Tax=unclassified Bradyrhizobium TaxID=2631580 RepID=UPI003F6F5057